MFVLSVIIYNQSICQVSPTGLGGDMWQTVWVTPSQRAMERRVVPDSVSNAFHKGNGATRRDYNYKYLYKYNQSVGILTLNWN